MAFLFKNDKKVKKITKGHIFYDGVKLIYYTENYSNFTSFSQKLNFCFSFVTTFFYII